MADDVTIKMLLEHQQGMKHEIQSQIKDLGSQISRLDTRVTSLEVTVREGFAATNQRLDALDEDLAATIRLQKHE